jgi:hypothetical protein
VNFGDPVPNQLAQPLNVFVNGEDEGFRVFGEFPESTEGAIGIANIAVVQVHIDDIVGFVTMPLSADIIGKVAESQKVSGLIQPDAIVYAQSLAGENFLGDVSDLGTAQNFKQLRSPPSSARENLPPHFVKGHRQNQAVTHLARKAAVNLSGFVCYPFADWRRD